MELKETANLMVSSDYKERFKAAYYQLKIRLEKLRCMLQKWDNKELSFTPSCPRSVYDVQVKSMQDYLAILEARAVIEKVEL